MQYYSPSTDSTVKSLNTLYRRQLMKDEVFKGEVHDFWELIYIESGELLVAEDDRVYEMQSGQIIFHKPMEFHRFSCPQGQTTRVIIISFDYQGHMIDALGDGVYDLTPALHQELIDVTDAINKHFRVTSMQIQQKEDHHAASETLTMLLFHTFLLHTLESADNRHRQQYNASAMHYRKIVSVLNEHIYENLSTEQIAELCCLGVSNLKKIFSMYAGCGVMHYFNTLKMIKAKELLRQDMSVAEISDRLSFSSPNYFTVFFKKQTGKLPTEYRRNPQH